MEPDTCEVPSVFADAMDRCFARWNGAIEEQGRYQGTRWRSADDLKTYGYYSSLTRNNFPGPPPWGGRALEERAGGGMAEGFQGESAGRAGLVHAQLSSDCRPHIHTTVPCSLPTAAHAAAGSGFVELLPNRQQAAARQLDSLYSATWLDLQTRAVFVEFLLYNLPTAKLVVGRLVVQFGAAGDAVPNPHFYSSDIYAKYKAITEVSSGCPRGFSMPSLLPQGQVRCCRTPHLLP